MMTLFSESSLDSQNLRTGLMVQDIQIQFLSQCFYQQESQMLLWKQLSRILAECTMFVQVPMVKIFGTSKMEKGTLEWLPIVENLAFLMKCFSRRALDPLKSCGQKKRSFVNSVAMFTHFIMFVTKRRQLIIHALPMGTARLQFPATMKSIGLTVSSRNQMGMCLDLWIHRPNPRLILPLIHMRIIWKVMQLPRLWVLAILKSLEGHLRLSPPLTIQLIAAPIIRM